MGNFVLLMTPAEPRLKRWKLFILCFLSLGCDGSSAPIVIGAAGPWQAGYGQMNRYGIELALSEINERGGIRGRPLEVVMRDDQASGAKAAAIAAEFIADSRVVAVVGHVNSGAMMAAAKVYNGDLAAVATTATSPDLTGISPWVFRVISSDSTNGLDIARFASSRGRRRAAILYENDSYGRGLTDAFRRSFVGDVISIDPIFGSEQDFEPYVSYYMRHAPDVVFVAGTEASGIAFLREARRQGLSADFLGGDGWTGIVIDTVASEGAFVGAPFAPSDPRPEAQRFVTAFEERYKRTPDGNAALAYDATMLVASAISEVGTRRAAVRAHLAGLSEETAFQGVTGNIRFRPDGDPVGKGIVITRVRRGSLVVEEDR